MKKFFSSFLYSFIPEDDCCKNMPFVTHPSTGFLHKVKSNLFFRLALTMLAILLLSGTSFAQVSLPSADRCTSKDLELVSARLNVTSCQTCDPDDYITAPLLLAIANKTGSTRTSFAFWGNIVIRSSYGNIVYQASVTGCNGPIVKNDTTELPFTVNMITVQIDSANSNSGISSSGQITYQCGSTLDLTNLFLAWTDASPKSTCPTLRSDLIAPKCGTLPSIAVSTGLTASAVVTQISCNGSGNGSINVSVTGGVAPYTYAWTTLDGTIPAGQADDQDLTNLGPGTYNLTVTDAASCTDTLIRTITEPAVVARPVVTITEATLCDTILSPYVTVLCPINGATYALTQTGVSGTKSPVLNTSTGNLEFRGLQPGRGFSVTVTVNGCTSEATTCSNYTTNSCPVASINKSEAVTNKVTAPPVRSLAKDTKLIAYPVPFNDRTTIEFKSTKSEDYEINLYDLNGTLIKQLKSGKAKPNEVIQVEVDGRTMAEGMYLARKISKSGMSSVKLLKKR